MSTLNEIKGMPGHCKAGNMITLKSSHHDEEFSHGNGATIYFEQNSNTQISFSAYIPPSVAGTPTLRFLVPSDLIGGCAVSLIYNNGSDNLKLKLGSTIIDE